MKPTVYVVTEAWDYEGEQVVCIASSLQTAKEEVRKRYPKASWQPKFEYYQVYPGTYVHITEHEVL